jgi:hypothetical protein
MGVHFTLDSRKAKFDVSDATFDLSDATFDLRHANFDSSYGKFDSRNAMLDWRNTMFDLRNTMKTSYPALFVFLLAFAVFAPTHQLSAQRAPRGKVRSLQATSDKAGQHPDSADMEVPVTILCINGVSETPNVQVSCRISAPGFNGVLNKGQSAKTTGPGTVTLKCNGQGFMRCNARIDIPPPSK